MIIVSEQFYQLKLKQLKIKFVSLSRNKLNTVLTFVTFDCSYSIHSIGIQTGTITSNLWILVNNGIPTDCMPARSIYDVILCQISSHTVRCVTINVIRTDQASFNCHFVIIPEARTVIYKILPINVNFNVPLWKFSYHAWITECSMH